MKGMMTIDNCLGREFFICACRDCGGNGSGIIPHFYSRKHAWDEGWRFTQDTQYSPDGVVAICPMC